MKGYIAICQHFHQPHFQLHNTREKVFRYSYLSWINMLESLSTIEGFYINLHFSGPFLYWLRSEKKEYLNRLAILIKNGNIGIIGGFADESFIQLSTRLDDVMFQIKEYEKLTETLFQINANGWQGFHIPERECGELLIRNITSALYRMNATPLYYLDAETFYLGHYQETGGEADYCEKLFGFKDSVSKTTISHYPKDMLRFAFRDMIGGKAFSIFPIHCEDRYWFLKCDDIIEINPKDYLDKIKSALQHATELSSSISKKIIPIAVIFEDAEKFGDWSGQPDRDTLWFQELINLICHDSDVELTGLKKYFTKQGEFDTYPIRSSHSYIEWENWTAKRGIRGVVYSDEKLRKMVTLLHHFESNIECFERNLIKDFTPIKSEKFLEAIMDSADRYECISELLQNNMGKEISEKYLLLQRIRNLLYQEDSKWATRHPNYGSAPYFDNMGVCFLEVAERLLSYLNSVVYSYLIKSEFSTADWMEDSQKRIVIHTEHQNLSIDPIGAAIDYNVVLNQQYKINEIFSKVLPDIKEMKSYPSIYRFVIPAVFTETDSKLCHTFSSNGERVEHCRKSFTISLSRRNGENFEQIATFSNCEFSLHKQELVENGYYLDFQACVPVSIDGRNLIAKLTREYNIKKNSIIVETSIELDRDIDIELFFSIEAVTSVTASDEVNLHPEEELIISPGEKKLCLEVTHSKDISKYYHCSFNGTVLYMYHIHTGAADDFWNGIKYVISGKVSVPHILISPTVGNYYKNYVGNEQSQLGYTASGVVIMPFMPLDRGQASIIVEQDFLWNMEKSTIGESISLVNY